MLQLPQAKEPGGAVVINVNVYPGFIVKAKCLSLKILKTKGKESGN